MRIVRVENGTVAEIIPEYAIPVEIWYGSEFASQCVEAPDEVEQGWTRNKDGSFKEPTMVNQTAVEIKEERSTAIKAACAEAIIGGFDADALGRGMLHYTLTQIQQRDLQTQYVAIQAGATEVLWRDSSRVTHEVYTAAQFTALFQTGYAYIISCKIRSDWLEQLVHDLADADKLTEATKVGWDTTLPEDYQTQCNAQIAAMLGNGNG
ncbi:hypothetical protein [Oscillibacter sp. GMB15532]|uniref:DUF4376 domain-containing protein n=1 Tax=Oscillibacter sp. GMB15532 TaxID=3230022 RepID=UPI0034DF5955